MPVSKNVRRCPIARRRGVRGSGFFSTGRRIYWSPLCPSPIAAIIASLTLRLCVWMKYMKFIRTVEKTCGFYSMQMMTATAVETAVTSLVFIARVNGGFLSGHVDDRITHMPLLGGPVKVLSCMKPNVQKRSSEAVSSAARTEPN